MKSLRKVGIIEWWGGRNVGYEYIKFYLTKLFEIDFKLELINA